MLTRKGNGKNLFEREDFTLEARHHLSGSKRSLIVLGLLLTGSTLYGLPSVEATAYNNTQISYSSSTTPNHPLANGDTITMTSGHPGIWATNMPGNAIVPQVTVTGSAYYPVYLSAGDLTFSSGTKVIAANVAGLWAVATTNGSTLTFNDSEITTNGNGAFGIGGRNGANVTTLNNCIIKTHGGYVSSSHTGANGIYDIGGTVNMNGGSVTTDLDHAHGVYGINGSTINVKDNATITTNDDTSYGLYVYNSVLNSEKATVKTFGDESYGILALYGATANITETTIDTQGDGALGVYVLSQTGTPTVANVAKSNITTLADETMGLVADGTDATINVTSTGSSDKTTIKTQGSKAHALYATNDGILNVTGDIDLDVTGTDSALIGIDGATVNVTNSTLDAYTSSASNLLLAAGADGSNLYVDNGTIKGEVDNKFNTTGSPVYAGITLKNNSNFEGSLHNDYIYTNVVSGSTWKVNNDSTVGVLTVDNSGTIDMSIPKRDGTAYQTLTVVQLNGSDGKFIMDTDLASETDGDKMVINDVVGATAGGKIQVYDKSLVTGAMVTGAKKLLLVTDVTGKTQWTGENLDTGGLWDLTPTIEKIGNDWYLKKIIRKESPNADTYINFTDASFGNLRTSMTDDTLRQRLGDLRYDDKQEAGLWARIKNGRMEGNNYDGSYQVYQVGYDKKINNSTYGLAVDYVKGSNTYSLGTGDNSATNLSLYSTNYRPSGVYSDIVLKAGKYNTDVDVPIYNDSADYSAWGYSASYELGKTIRRNNGFFVEPQAQLVLGHMQGVDYRSDKTVEVNSDAMNSFLGRAGVVVGRQIKNTGDYYVKANVWKEFAGNGEVNLSALNNYGTREYMTKDIGHKDYWLELGIGGNAKLNDTTYIYGDLAKTFKGDFNKKWQINAGVRWEF